MTAQSHGATYLWKKHKIKPAERVADAILPAMFAFIVIPVLAITGAMQIIKTSFKAMAIRYPQCRK